MDVNIRLDIQSVGKRERDKNKERDKQKEQIQRMRCSIYTSLEIGPFKIRYLKHPSFTRYSLYRQNKGGMERRRRSGRDKAIESERKETKGLNKYKRVLMNNVFL